MSPKMEKPADPKQMSLEYNVGNIEHWLQERVTELMRTGMTKEAALSQARQEEDHDELVATNRHGLR